MPSEGKQQLRARLDEALWAAGVIGLAKTAATEVALRFVEELHDENQALLERQGVALAAIRDARLWQRMFTTDSVRERQIALLLDVLEASLSGVAIQNLAPTAEVPAECERLSAEVERLRQVINKVRELADDWEKKPDGFDPHKKLTDRSADYWDGRSSTFKQCSDDLRAVLAEVAPTAEEAHPKRYGQCDGTCTADCGHCKGQGKPPIAEAVQP